MSEMERWARHLLANADWLEEEHTTRVEALQRAGELVTTAVHPSTQRPMNTKEQAIFEQIPAPPAGADFRPRRVTTYYTPHPYCIGARHVAYAADHFGGMLGVEAIEAAEHVGIYCATRGCRAAYADHVGELALDIEIPQGVKDLNAVPGLHAYLLSIKDQATALGIEGFAFPPKGA